MEDSAIKLRTVPSLAHQPATTVALKVMYLAIARRPPSPNLVISAGRKGICHANAQKHPQIRAVGVQVAEVSIIPVRRVQNVINAARLAISRVIALSQLVAVIVLLVVAVVVMVILIEVVGEGKLAIHVAG